MDSEKKNVKKARDDFYKNSATDSRPSSTQQLDEKFEKFKRIRHLSGTEHFTITEHEPYDGQFRKRSNSYGHAVSPKLSSRIKDFFKPKPTPSSSSESITGKSPPSKNYLKVFNTPPSSKKFETDGRSNSPTITKPSTSRQNSKFEPAQVPGLSDDNYNMNHRYRGKAIIFNHITFDDPDLPEREGAEEDVKKLEKTLLKLGFRDDDIEVLVNSTFSDITKKLDYLSQEDHSQNDLLMMFVLTHGEKDDRIHAYDIEYQVSKLWKPFTAEKCKSLAGKPKIFFIVACRGDSADQGAQIVTVPNRRKASINTETDAALMGPVVSYTIPVWADFLTVYSTVQGYFSYRDADTGTWYIKALCEEIDKIEKKPFHFTDLLTKVNRKIAISYETYHEVASYSKKKQCPFISSTLTRLIFFDDKN